MENSSSYLTSLSDSSSTSFPSPQLLPQPIGDPSVSPGIHSAAADVEALRQLSRNLSSLLQSPGFEFCADAFIVSSIGEIAVHRCVLSARSQFFRDVFAKLACAPGGPPVKIELKELITDVDVGHEVLVVVLKYLYSGTLDPLPETVCRCVDDECGHEACRPVVDFMVQVIYAFHVFQMSELVNHFQHRLLDTIDMVAVDDIPVILSVANLCIQTCNRLLARCIDIATKSDLDVVTLEKALPEVIVKQIVDARRNLGLIGPEGPSFPDKHMIRIHKALDSDDVELVRMLLTEGQVTLDDANALHYAVAHCHSKITSELLDLGLADVNRRNLRGYTVLHIAALRREPQIIVSLLTKGAQPAELTFDGRKALQISKRLTKYGDYYCTLEQGKPSPKDRLCIEILEQAERRDPLLGEASVSLAMAGDDLRVKLLYLENRVALARMLFPMEARVAMEIAQVDGTLEFTLNSAPNPPNGSQRAAVDLNEAPFRIKEEHLLRIKALSRTVELGKRFFPRCSRVIDKIMDDEDMYDLANFGDDGSTSNKRRTRYHELLDDIDKAFSEDKEFNRSTTLSSSSSSTSMVHSKASRR